MALVMAIAMALALAIAMALAMAIAMALAMAIDMTRAMASASAMRCGHRGSVWPPVVCASAYAVVNLEVPGLIPSSCRSFLGHSLVMLGTWDLWGYWVRENIG